MLISAIGLLEAEYKFLKKNTSDWPPVEGNEYFYMVIGMGAAVQTSAIATMPYVGLSKVYAAAYDYQWLRTAPQHKIKGFRAGPGVPKGIHPYGWSSSKAAGRRLLAARIGARFIPYVGWALLAYDVYSVGKWAHERWA